MSGPYCLPGTGQGRLTVMCGIGGFTSGSLPQAGSLQYRAAPTYPERERGAVWVLDSAEGQRRTLLT